MEGVIHFRKTGKVGISSLVRADACWVLKSISGIKCNYIFIQLSCLATVAMLLQIIYFFTCWGYINSCLYLAGIHILMNETKQVGYYFAPSGKPYPDNWIITDVIYEIEGSLYSR